MTKSDFFYKRQRTALSFPSCLYHKSVHAEETKMKLCLFLKDKENIIAPESSAQTTCGERLRQQSDLVTKKSEVESNKNILWGRN